MVKAKRSTGRPASSTVDIPAILGQIANDRRATPAVRLSAVKTLIRYEAKRRRLTGDELSERAIEMMNRDEDSDR